MTTNHGVQQYGGTSQVGVQAVGAGARAEADHVELALDRPDTAETTGTTDNRVDGTVGNAVQAGTINGPVTINVEQARPPEARGPQGGDGTV